MQHAWEYINAYKIVVEKHEGKRTWDTYVDGMILLKLILKRWGVRVWTG
jgi:hypothetical protein